MSARLAARPETRGRNTAELNISTSKELSRTLVCKGQSVVRVAADARVRLSDLPVPTFAGSDTKRPRISTFHTPRRRSPIYASSQRPGLNECSKPLYAQGRASSAAYGNRFVSGFCLLSTSLASDPSSQMCLLVVSVVMDQCAAAVPIALMKHLGVLPAHKSRRRPSRAAWQSRRGQEMLALSAVYHRALSPRQPTTPRRPPSGSPFRPRLARPSDPPARLAPNRRLANRIAFSHVLNSAHRLQVYLGHPRLNAPAIEHVRRSGSQGPPRRARQPVR